MSTLHMVREQDIAHQYAYASAYAIQISPIVCEDSEDVSTFLTQDGETTVWPCMAMLLDTPEDARNALFRASNYPRCTADDGTQYPRPVKIKFECEITPLSDTDIKVA